MRSRKKLRRDRAVGKAAMADRDGVPTIVLGPANIWDGGDLGRIRDAASAVLDAGGRRVGIDLAHVGVLPSGFLHMLCTWQEQGAEVYLFAPRPNVRDMFWFHKFARRCEGDVWRMNCVSTHDEASPHSPLFSHAAAESPAERQHFQARAET